MNNEVENSHAPLAFLDAILVCFHGASGCVLDRCETAAVWLPALLFFGSTALAIV